MAFNIDQYRKKSNVQYITSVPIVSIQANNNTITYTIGNILDINKKYYFKIKIKQHSNIYNVVAQLHIQPSDTDNTQRISSYKIKSGVEVLTYETTIAPVLNNFQYIVVTGSEEILNADDVVIEIYAIKNIMDDFKSTTITHLGVQGEPYLLLCLNGNPVRVGRSGLLEINNPNINFNFIGVIPFETNFIIDYQW